jgi:hypothetical protein
MAAGAAADQAFGLLAQQLENIGLGELFKYDGGKPSGWLWQQIQAGVDTSEELMAAIQSTTAFKDRFGVIVEQQKRAAKGEPVYVMSPAEVIEYEQRVKQVMKSAGFPAGFYDEPSDFHKLILQDMSAAEVEQRVMDAFDYVESAPPEVKQAFNNYFGTGAGDKALAAWALDPERTVRDIRKATRTAFAAGISQRFDVAINRTSAERIAELNMSDDEVRRRMEAVAQAAPIYTESIGETGNDITSDDGVSSIFEADAEATAQMSRRTMMRQGANQRSTGGAVVTQEGVVGAGSS